MKNLDKAILVLSVFSAIFLAGCRKDKDEDLDTDTRSSADHFFMESQLNDELREVDEAAVSSGLGKSGPVITIDSSASPRKMTIDYGKGTLCADGKTRSGRLNVTWTGRYRQTGSVITITPDSFYQSGHKTDGTKTIENKGRNAAGNLHYTVTVINARVTRTDGRILTWNAQRDREWIAGEGTLTWRDDVYLLTGNASGAGSGGVSYSLNITTPLRVDLGCEYRLTAGIVELVPYGKRMRTVNYGDGTCDNTFTVTIGSKTYTIN